MAAGSRCRTLPVKPPAPSPRPGTPVTVHAKPRHAKSVSLDAVAQALGTPHAAWGAWALRGLDSSRPAGRPASALSRLYLSAGCLGVHGAPPAGCALSPGRFLREPTAGALQAAPRPRLRAPPPGSEPRPRAPGPAPPRRATRAQWVLHARSVCSRGCYRRRCSSPAEDAPIG